MLVGGPRRGIANIHQARQHKSLIVPALAYKHWILISYHVASSTAFTVEATAEAEEAWSQQVIGRASYVAPVWGYTPNLYSFTGVADPVKPLELSAAAESLHPVDLDHGEMACF